MTTRRPTAVELDDWLDRLTPELLDRIRPHCPTALLDQLRAAQAESIAAREAAENSTAQHLPSAGIDDWLRLRPARHPHRLDHRHGQNLPAHARLVAPRAGVVGRMEASPGRLLELPAPAQGRQCADRPDLRLLRARHRRRGGRRPHLPDDGVVRPVGLQRRRLPELPTRHRGGPEMTSHTITATETNRPKDTNMATIRFTTAAADVGYDVQFAFDRQVVELIKQTVPSSCRTWSQARRRWFVDAAWAPMLAAELRRRGHTVVGLEEHRRERVTHHDGRGWADSLFAAVGPGRATAVYRSLSRILHPDVATGDTTLQHQLNVAYSEITASTQRTA